MNQDTALWPDIDVSRWAGTKRSLHLYTQMLGKIKVVRAPFEPNWMYTRLLLTPRGLTTGFIPWRGTSFAASIDVFDSAIVLTRSTGTRIVIPLLPVRTVADVFADVERALNELGVECAITPIPQEIPDTTPLNEDRRPSEYDPGSVLRWFGATTATAGVFEEWRATFFGRAGVQLWWGAFDLALILFNGKKVVPPTDRGYLMKYDLDAELLNVGLYFGDEKTPPFFYGYIYPEPPKAERLPIEPSGTSWSSQLHEWLLPYDAVRNSSRPDATIHAFIDSIYELCFQAAGWDREALRYRTPKR